MTGTSAIPASSPATEVRWPVVAVAVGGTIVCALPPFMTAALSVQIRGDLGSSIAVMGALFGLWFGAGALGSPFLGAVVDRIGWRAGMRLSMAVIGTVLVGMATFVTDAAVIVPLFIVGGLAAAAGNTSANRALALWVPAERFGILFGLKHSAAPTATLLGGLAVPVLALTAGWRWAFGIGAVAAVAVAAGVPRSGNQRRGLRSAVSRTGARPDTPLAGLVMLAGVAALGIAAIDSVTPFVTSYAVDGGMAEGSAGLLLGCASLMGLTTRLTGGWLIDRRQRASLTTIAGLLAVGAVGLVTLAAGGTGWLIPGVLVAYLGGWGWSGLMTFTVVHANRSAPAAATGISQTGTFVGAAVGPPIVSLIADEVSYGAALWTSTAMMVVAVALALAARRYLQGPSRSAPVGAPPP